MQQYLVGGPPADDGSGWAQHGQLPFEACPCVFARPAIGRMRTTARTADLEAAVATVAQADGPEQIGIWHAWRSLAEVLQCEVLPLASMLLEEQLLGLAWRVLSTRHGVIRLCARLNKFCYCPDIAQHAALAQACARLRCFRDGQLGSPTDWVRNTVSQRGSRLDCRPCLPRLVGKVRPFLLMC